jgi:hypothetical protein
LFALVSGSLAVVIGAPLSYDDTSHFEDAKAKNILHIKEFGDAHAR